MQLTLTHTFSNTHTHTYLVPHVVQVPLELVLHLLGEVGAAAADLLHLGLLFLTGQVEGHGVGEQGVDPGQEATGHRLDALQRLGEVLFALPGVGGELRLQVGVVLLQGDVPQVVGVALLDGAVPLVGDELERLGEVGLHQAEDGGLLGVLSLQGFQLRWRRGQKVGPPENNSRSGILLTTVTVNCKLRTLDPWSSGALSICILLHITLNKTFSIHCQLYIVYIFPLERGEYCIFELNRTERIFDYLVCHSYFTFGEKKLLLNEYM